MNPMKIESDQIGEYLIGVCDVFYGFGQELIARGFLTRPEIAGVLEVMIEAQKAQGKWTPARAACAASLRTAFAAVDPHAPQKAPTVTPGEGGQIQ